MGIYRVFTGPDGETHMEEISLESHPELGALTELNEVSINKFDGTRKTDFSPAPDHRIIVHLSGEVEGGTTDGTKRIFRSGDIRVMEDVTGLGHSHLDLSPSEAVHILLRD